MITLLQLKSQIMLVGIRFFKLKKELSGSEKGFY